MSFDRRRVASTAIIILSLFVVALPELNKSIVRAEEDVVAGVLSYFTQPELFMLEFLDLSGEWRYVVKSYEEGVFQNLYWPSAPLDGWNNVTVPFMFYAGPRNSTLWLRRDFEVPEHLKGYRLRLVFLGAFYKASVWLNGVFIGEHEGYFAPFFFDVADVVNYSGVNSLVVCLSTPVELDLDNKRSLLGVFGDWDIKPYPRWALGKLPRRYEWVVPIGLWRPVKLVVSGQVAVSVTTIDTEYSAASASSARVKLYVSNTGGEGECEVRYWVKPYNFEGEGSSGSFKFRVGRGERKWVEGRLAVPNARPWQLWDRGSPHLYMLEYELWFRGELQGRGAVKFGFREVTGEVSRTSAAIRINGERVFLRGVNYISDFLLVNATREALKRDIEMMLKAHVNFVRVHAHVEPREFYELADEAGIAVQADAPLIWAYASWLGSGDYARFVRKCQAQIAEMVFMLYNHPSVIIWTVHNEPPWACEWMGDLYRRGVNRDLDWTLAAVISALDSQGRIVIRGSGFEDQHVYYGWFSGNWDDFARDRSPFPTEFGAQALPSADSPFWSLVEISRWPVNEGDPEYFELAYRGFYWASGYVRIPYGLPRDYPTLDDYIKASQEYQARLLKAAIARYRLLKFNVTAGFAMFIFKDCFPSVSFSIVDYFGVPKLGYYAVAEMLKPLKVIVEPMGDLQVRGVGVEYGPGSLFKARIWVVNDASNVSGVASLSWELVDLSAGWVLDKGHSQVAIPRSEEPATLAASISSWTPVYTDGEHEVELRVALLMEGVEVDREVFSFKVAPASEVIVKLADVTEPLKFYVSAEGRSFYLQSRDGRIAFSLPAGSRATIYGPVLNASSPYLPIAYDLGALQNGVVELELKLVEGALFVIRTPMPSLDGSLPRVRLRVKTFSELPGPHILSYDQSNAAIALALGLTGYQFVLPAGIPLNVSYEVEWGSRQASFTVGPLNLSRGEVYVDDRLAKLLASEALELCSKELSNVLARLRWLEKRGFYAGLTREVVKRASEAISEARRVVEDSPEVSATLAREARNLLVAASESIGKIYAGARVNIPSLLFIIILASLGSASMLIEDESRRLAVGVALLVILVVMVYVTYPGITDVDTVELILGMYASFLALILLTVVPYLLEGVRSEKGLPVFAAAAVALSVAARNLRRRGLRTALALLSVVALSLAVSSLSSISYYATTRELVTTAKVQEGVENSLMVFSERGLTLNDVVYVFSQPETLEAGFMVSSAPRLEPYGYHAARTIRAFIALHGYSPVKPELSKVVWPPSALEELSRRSDAVLVSSAWRDVGVQLGDTVDLAGIKLRVVGFYDPRALSSLKDIGGYDILPLSIRPDGTVEPVHPDEMVIAAPDTATRLGGFIKRIYARTGSGHELLSLAKRLSTQGGYVAVTRAANDYIRVYFPASTVEFRGSEALLPVVFVFLNVASVVLASVYERRSEIFTLASVGLNPTHIFLVFLSEALLLGFVGGALGYLASFAVFRGLQLSAAMVPVDVKSDLNSMVFVIALSAISSVAAGVLPALKASAYATPSLARRWKLEAEVVGGLWRVEIPARVTADKAPQFAEFVVERLKEEGYGIERAITDVMLHERVEGGMQIYEIAFTYGRGGSQPFTAPSRLVIRPSDQGFYNVQLLVKPHSVYQKLYQRHVQEVASFIRSVTLEWASLRVRLLAPVGVDPTSVVELIRHYNPQLVIVVSRRGDPRIVREIRGRVRGLGLRPPAIELVDLKGKSVDELATEIKNLIPKADIVAIDSDDGVLSATVALAAAAEGRRVSVLREGRVEEASVDKLLKPAA